MFLDVILPPFSLCCDFLFMTLKVRFNIATHRETKKERATNVEILPESFEESIEQRRHVSAHWLSLLIHSSGRKETTRCNVFLPPGHCD